MGNDGAVGQLQGRELLVPGGGAQLVARPLAEERDGMAVRRDHLLVPDALLAQRLLNPAAGVVFRPLVVAMAHVQGGNCGVGHGPGTASAARTHRYATDSRYSPCA